MPSVVYEQSHLNGVGRSSLKCVATLTVLMLGLNVSFAQEADLPAIATCADEAGYPDRPQLDERPKRVHQLAPSAGGVERLDLYEHARFAASAYDAYKAFEAGAEVDQTVPADLTREALIYGTPAPDAGPEKVHERGKTLYGYVARDDQSGQRYFVFRGTMQPAEWIRNIQARQTSFNFGGGENKHQVRVHRGFFQIYASLELEGNGPTRSLSEALEDGSFAAQETFFIGHSLGGALALLAAVEGAHTAPDRANNLHVITLASPRVGNEALRDASQSMGSVTRICNLVDAVPTLPVSTPRTQYMHVGTPVRYSSYDYPELLESDQARAGEQILCWHNLDAYYVMLNPAHNPDPMSSCFKQ